MAFKKYARKKLTQAGKAGRTYAKKRYLKRSTGALKTGKLARDVMMLKNLINVEKKFYNLSTISANVGQCLVNATGAIIQDITPTPAQGTAVNQITGHSFKLTGAYMEVQLKQQSGLTTEASYIFEIWDVKGTPDTTATIFGDLFNTSTFSGIVDSYSTRNQDHFADFRCIKRWVMKFKQDSTTPASGSLNQVLTRQIPLKLNKHIRINSGGTIQNGQMVMTVRSNYGNCGTTDSTLSNLGTQTLRTGAEMLFTTKYWYVDN